MKRKRFSWYDRDKRVNTIIEIRKEMLYEIRKISEGLDREIYTLNERSIARRELRAIAEMIRDKDKLMRIAYVLPKISKNDREKNIPIVSKMREFVIKIFYNKKNDIIATQYDKEELEIVHKELKEMETLVIEKDRIRPKRGKEIFENTEKRQNPYLNKYFNMEMNHSLD